MSGTREEQTNEWKKKTQREEQPWPKRRAFSLLTTTCRRPLFGLTSESKRHKETKRLELDYRGSFIEGVAGSVGTGLVAGCVEPGGSWE